MMHGYVDDIIREEYMPLRDLFVGKTLALVDEKTKLEIAVDVFVAEGDKEAEKDIAESRFADFNYSEEELVYLKSWVDTYQQAVFWASERERPLLMPTQRDFEMYYTVRGSRPLFISSDLRFWRVLFYLIGLVHKKQREYYEQRSVSVIHQFNFKPSTFVYTIPFEITDELKRLKIPYDIFCKVLTRRFVIHSVAEKAATYMIKRYIEENKKLPDSVGVCWRYLGELGENVNQEYAYATIRRVLQRRIDDRIANVFRKFVK